LLREAGLSLLPVPGAQWNVGNGAFSRDEPPGPQTDQLHLVLAEWKWDMTVAEFLQKYFAAPES
jgi:monoamine oxidase